VSAFASVLHGLGDPWSDGIMRRALVEVALLALVGGTLGCWIVLQDLAYGAESLAHGMLPGLVLAALTGLPLLLGGAAGILVAAAGIALAGRVELLGRDSAIAAVVTSLFGLGALLALSPATPAGIEGLLFGDVLGTSGTDLIVAAALAAVVVGGLWLAHWRLLAVGFDRASARSVGAHPSLADALLLGLLAIAVLVAVQGLGNLLVVAVLVAPAAVARRLARRLSSAMLLAVLVGITAGIAGLYLSYYADIAAGAAIAGMLVAAYVLATVIGRRHRRRSRWWPGVG
jgi:ABC-type Mn2+/Zn2+ transport system permease subunit